MKVLVTGSDGFIGKNLCISLSELSDIETLKFNRSHNLDCLDELIRQADFIFHLAGENRPKNESDFFAGNADLTEQLCSLIKKYNRNIPIVLTSSIQAEQPNPYGRSKLRAEMHLLNLYMDTSNTIYIYRLPNVFGKWCKPNYNSVVATFCHNICRGLPITINDPDTELNLAHIDTVVASFVDVLLNRPVDHIHIELDPIYKVTLGVIAEYLYQFRDSRESLITERVGGGFIRALYATYISYMSPDNFSYSLAKHEDARGCFVEMLKTQDSGQFSFFTAYPGVIRGGHYHHVKSEKFLVIRGKARFGFRHIVTNETFEIYTSGESPEVVETVPGWSHDVTNVGNDELIVMLWANENFDKERPDTVAHMV
ncbi:MULTISPECIES: NAD-dependent epimerase/dehydratase family protein [Photorhabdus]|uniref:Capsular biosynthesis protein n=1 Tax=Photorhabdus thracensis TaxID=230089 RepID=A0A0F7LJH2_9GAMM|nr:NAD-dependent epimerase/dehydratase family protein [Photorhabdus thracensis]AKH63234.1 capsular biosynthesis protein [Photorhabdus thracensis]MCC8422689.1 NAD-dependent epimerase/dehydratase family protein [Photorhabdus thracensis]